MAKYVLLGKYSADSMKGISEDRTKKAVNFVEKNGGKMVGFYALLGQFDLLLIAEFPGNQEAMKASLAISKLTGIAFHTLPATDVKEFDKLAAGV